MTHHPSQAQFAAYEARPARRPVALFYQYRCKAGVDAARIVADLDRLARRHQGARVWSGCEEQALIGPLPLYERCVLFRFDTRAAALDCVRDDGHAQILRGAEAVQLAVLSDQPKLSRRIVGLLKRVLPWVPFDNREENTPEPGMGTSIMPTEAGLAAFMAHPQQRSPVVMINWLRFRPEARYEPPRDKPISGQAAYYLYGRVAFAAIHSLGGHAFFVSRYQQILIGNGGDPGIGLWNDFVLVEYPGRAAFKRMASLTRYRAGLAHRQAGLAEQGQGLTVATHAG